MFWPFASLVVSVLTMSGPVTVRSQQTTAAATVTLTWSSPIACTTAIDGRELLLQCDRPLEDTVRFAGRVKLDEYLGRIDVTVLTSISEAQPLVVLEAGALGIPSVTTDVGSCRDLIFGPAAEQPSLGPAGDVTPLCNPTATAEALVRLLTEPDWYERCGRAIKERVRVSYNKVGVDRTYHELYARHLTTEKVA